jgi:hypothetical protein
MKNLFQRIFLTSEMTGYTVNRAFDRIPRCVESSVDRYPAVLKALLTRYPAVLKALLTVYPASLLTDTPLC